MAVKIVKKTSRSSDLFIFKNRVHLQHLKGMQHFRLYVKGVPYAKRMYTKGAHFLSKWYIKGQGVGPRGGASP